jgi:hypothetical protein
VLRQKRIVCSYDLCQLGYHWLNLPPTIILLSGVGITCFSSCCDKNTIDEINLIFCYLYFWIKLPVHQSKTRQRSAVLHGDFGISIGYFSASRSADCVRCGRQAALTQTLFCMTDRWVFLACYVKHQLATAEKYRKKIWSSGKAGKMAL